MKHQSAITFFFLFLVIGCSFFYGMKIALNRSEAAECVKWQSQAKKYPTFYITVWQADQCAAYNVEIDAPVR